MKIKFVCYNLIIIIILWGCSNEDKNKDKNLNLITATYKDSILNCKLWEENAVHIVNKKNVSLLEFYLLNPDTVIVSSYDVPYTDTIKINEYDRPFMSSLLDTLYCYGGNIIYYGNKTSIHHAISYNEKKIIIDTVQTNIVKIKFLRRKRELDLKIKVRSLYIKIIEYRNKPYQYLVYYDDCFWDDGSTCGTE